MDIMIHLRFNNVHRSMGKHATQAQLIKTRILYCRSIMYCTSCVLQQILYVYTIVAVRD